jgi:polyisoprenoid-binding protein YceI
VSSIDTGQSFHLQRNFNIAKFPEITFKSRNVRQTAAKWRHPGDPPCMALPKPIILHVKLATPLTNEALPSERVGGHDRAAAQAWRFRINVWSATEAVSGISQNVAIKTTSKRCDRTERFSALSDW